MHQKYMEQKKNVWKSTQIKADTLISFSQLCFQIS
jgi:hypothetical protein